jgi:NADP-dependent 3-hydroxy acid dehydrogenase YdfG
MADSPVVPVWLITGSTSGFGQAIARTALSRGHKVIATARDASKLKALKESGAETLSMDVTADLETLRKIAEDANGKFGRVTHLVNAAGYILEGAVEEAR